MAKGRAAVPTAAIIDSQSVKTSCNVSESSQGIDAGKKIKGRKRHIATDVLGLLLVVIVTAASVQDSVDGQRVLDQLADMHPSVSKVWVDGGYNNSVLRHGARQGIQVDVVKRTAATGFHALPRRWVVERTLGWLMQHRRLVRDYEALPQRSRTMIHWAMANKMSPRTDRRIHPNLANRSSQTGHLHLNQDQMPS